MDAPANSGQIMLLTIVIDRIMITTDLPCATWPYEGFQSFNTEAAAGSGVEYCRKHFGIEPEIVNFESGNHKKIK